MSELKAYRFLGRDEVCPDARLGSDYYLKSEADKVIAELEDRLQAANEQIENIINSASSVMLFQDRVKDDKCAELRHQKYKRCLAMARWCEAEVHKCLTQQGALICFPETDRFQYLQGHFMYFSRWHDRWLELAEKFKPNKEAK